MDFDFLKEEIVEVFKVLEDVSSNKSALYRIQAAELLGIKEEIINREQNLESGIEFALIKLDMILNVITNYEEKKKKFKVIK